MPEIDSAHFQRYKNKYEIKDVEILDLM